MLKPQIIRRPDADVVAARLRQLMRALNKRPSEMADESGIKRNAWSQYTAEKDPRLITLDAAYRLKKWGITLDWLYGGDLSGMKVYLVEALNAVPVPIVGRIGHSTDDHSQD